MQYDFIISAEVVYLEDASDDVFRKGGLVVPFAEAEQAKPKV